MPLSLDDSTIKQRLTAYLAGLPGIRFASLFGSWPTFDGGRTGEHRT
jgi:hypothetical protein